MPLASLSFSFCLFVTLSAVHCHSVGRSQDDHPRPSVASRKLAGPVEGPTHWFESADAAITTKLAQRSLEGRAKKLILFVGDGMSVSTITAARIYKGQQEGLAFGEEGELYMDRFPFTGTSKTYCSDWQVADSACSATAYFSGIKANSGTVGVTPTVNHSNCTAQRNPANQVSSILTWAQAAGMSTGIVTTTTVTHASPSGAYAHIANRNWENDAEVQNSGWSATDCDDIAEQLVLQSPGNKFNVILGGGREHWLDQQFPDMEDPEVSGKRTDGRNLIEHWLQEKLDGGNRAQFVYTKEQLLNSTTTSNDYLLGLFGASHIGYVDEHEAGNDPSLEDMTRVAVQILSRNPNGFYLFVEGGRIDQAHHSNYGQRALRETLQFDDAIKLTDEMTSDEETLIVVTSDHSHLFTLAGDPLRGNPILGLSGNTDNNDGLPFGTLAYINGPGYKPHVMNEDSVCVRADISADDVNGPLYQQVAQVPRGSATHAGEDVLIYAKGPWAQLFVGTNEQSFIPHAMAYAACINPHGQNMCDREDSVSTTHSGTGSGAVQVIVLLVQLMLIYLVNCQKF